MEKEEELAVRGKRKEIEKVYKEPGSIIQEESLRAVATGGNLAA